MGHLFAILVLVFLVLGIFHFVSSMIAIYKFIKMEEAKLKHKSEEVKKESING